VKKIYLTAWLALAAATILRAQTNVANTNAVAEILALVTTNAPPTPPAPPVATQISSDSWDYDNTTRQAVYHGDVRVDSPQTKLTCAQLTVDFPQQGGRINHIVAETNVVIDHTDEKGATNHITCDRMVYDYKVQDAVTNETVTFTGSPQIVDAQGTNTADVIVWDRGNGHIRESNPRMSPRQNPFEGANTNSAAASTNNFSMPKLF
jgi:lipopolysaccharide transport protein LptA